MSREFVYKGRDRWHFESNGSYACTSGELPRMAATLSPNEVAAEVRCTRRGCAERWPNDHQPVVQRADERVVARGLGGALSHLGEVGHEYSVWADGAKDVLTAAAKAEAEYRSRKAQVKLSFRARGEAKSDADAETKADADPEIAGLLMERLTSRAVADAHLEKLRQLRSRNENGRTYAATERTLDQLHSQDRAGAA